MVKSGSYTVKQPSIFGRLGTGIGQGLAEQVPKEIERYRLAEGLKNFEQESGNLTPLQQLSRFSAIPGALEHPQLMQSFANLARQQARGNALADLQNQTNQPKPSPFPKTQPEVNSSQDSKVPSLTKGDVFAEAQEGYIPPTREKIDQEAGRAYNENPARFDNDPEKAIAWAEDKANRERDINEAYQRKHENLTRIQDNVVKRLQDHANRLNVKVPTNAYSLIEDKAIQSTKPKREGGKGLTEQQAMKEYGNELDKVSRDYESIDTIGSWALISRPASESLRSLKNLSDKFDERNDSENFADTMIEKNKFSPKMSYSIAKRVSRIPALNKEISSLPPIKGKITASVGMLGTQMPKRADVDSKTLDASEKLAPYLKGNDKISPLAIAYELEKKGYNPSVWLEYLVKNRKNLGLTEAQGREIDKPNNLTGTLSDWWLSSWSGLEK